MKKAALLLAIAGTVFIILALRNSETKTVGAVGDVKYSVLPPDKFKEENGEGWALMDDKIPLNGSVLKDKHGVQELPDARGLFIRCLNLTRGDDYSDMFKNENNRDRQMGEYQPDAIKKHTHNMSHSFGFFCGWDRGNQWSGGQRGNPMASNQPECPITMANVGSNLNGDETRPKNLALYTYVKIND